MPHQSDTVSLLSPSVQWCLWNQNCNLAGKRPQEVSGPTSSSKQGQLWAWTGLLRPLSRQVLKNLQGWRHNHFGQPPLLLDCPHGEMKAYFISSLNLSGFNLCPLSLCHSMHHFEKPVCLPGNFSLGTGWKAAVTVALTLPHSGLNKPNSLSHSSHGKSWPFCWPSTEFTPVYQCISCIQGSKTRHSILDVV